MKNNLLENQGHRQIFKRDVTWSCINIEMYMAQPYIDRLLIRYTCTNDNTTNKSTYDKGGSTKPPEPPCLYASDN